jgi:hypothetical protein
VLEVSGPAEDSAASPSPPESSRSLSCTLRMSLARKCADSSAETETRRGWGLYFPPPSRSSRSASALRRYLSARSLRILLACSRIACRRSDACSRMDDRENGGLGSGIGPRSTGSRDCSLSAWLSAKRVVSLRLKIKASLHTEVTGWGAINGYFGFFTRPLTRNQRDRGFALRAWSVKRN